MDFYLLDSCKPISNFRKVLNFQKFVLRPFSKNIDFSPKNLCQDDLLDIDIMFGFNDGDAFGWANNEFPFLNKHPLGMHYDEIETIQDVIKQDFMKQARSIPF